ncbi:MAG: sigma-70 family RNA polymerase sigma factor [Gemmataceae bacterium]|nr:sigma-70 family RNA polymerase sigma factor [Gemmataceae bacterium]
MQGEDPYGLRPLLDRVAGGDRSALNELFTRLRPWLHSLVKRQLGDGHAAASDIVQSGLRRANERLDDLLADDPTVPHLLAWIKKIVRNRAIDEVRRQRPANLADPDEQLGAVPDHRPPEATAERDERAVGVMAALAKLPERQRQVVELHYFDRLRDAEISARLGGSVAAIRVLRCRALKAMRTLLGDGDEPE